MNDLTRDAQRPVAVITGASSGIGEAVACLAAADGYRVVLVARRKDRLDALADRIGADLAVPLALDLTDPGAGGQLQAALAERGLGGVEILVNNAGFGLLGPFAAAAPEDLVGMIDLNIRALVDLSRRFLPDMLQQRRGGILNVASLAAFQPGPVMATYYASKAFVLSFSEALAMEARDKGVTVTALCPGPTDTEFFDRAGPGRTTLLQRMPRMTSEAVAKAGWAGFKRGQRVVIPGLSNKVSALFAPHLPHALLLPIVKQINSKR